MDGDLNRLKEAKDAVGFAGVLEEMMANELTNDFWAVTLPANLDSSSARNPELFAYIEAQNRLGAPVLFSHKKVPDLLDPAIKTKKKALERHHLFPRAWLESQGVEDLKRINQLANFALLEWPENIDISDLGCHSSINRGISGIMYKGMVKTFLYSALKSFCLKSKTIS